MSVILIMLPAALILAGLGVGAFISMARSGQFDDLDTPPIRAVFDDDETPAPRERDAHEKRRDDDSSRRS